MKLEPYLVKNGMATFDVSEADFDNLKSQVADAIEFLRLNEADVKLIMTESNTTGVLDFAIERRDVAAQFDSFPSELVRLAGGLGLAIELSQYQVEEARAEA